MAAEVPNREPAWVTLHHRVQRLAGCLGKLVGLIHERPTAEVGLLRLSQYLVVAEPPEEWDDPGDPGHIQAWREAIDEAGALLSDVQDLWPEDRAGPGSSLKLLFEEAHGDVVRCGPLHALSHHGLMINLVECLLDPAAAELDLRAYSLRKQVARALGDAAFDPERLCFDLDKEYVQARRLMSLRDDDVSSAEDRRGAEDAAPELREELRGTALLAQNPDWSAQQLADALGIGRSTIYRRAWFTQAREAMRQAHRSAQPRGWKEDGVIEAEASHGDDELSH